jgi:hypothetical protein
MRKRQSDKTNPVNMDDLMMQTQPYAASAHSVFLLE